MASVVAPSPFVRSDMVRRLADETFDVLVIGGGITGCGVALDAASRGLRVALVERGDFGSGASSKGSKVIDGGLRSLQRREFRLVFEALRERRRLVDNAPHLVSVIPLLIPMFVKGGPTPNRTSGALRSAMWFSDATGGMRIGKRHRRVDRAEALAHCPTLPADRVSSGLTYDDAAADDARVTLAVARTAADHGAAIANRCRVIDLVTGTDGRVCGAVVDAGHARFEVRASIVVSAAGVWAGQIERLAAGTAPATPRPAKGVHITVPWELVRNDTAVVVPVPNDGRNLFLIPWQPRGDGTFERCSIGSTDTDFDGSLDDPQTDSGDLAYVLGAVNHHLTTAIGHDDVTAVWAGLRPVSRRHRVTVGEHGLVAVTGGRFATYRQVAEDVVDVVVDRLGRSAACRTAKLRLLGAPSTRPTEPPADRLHGRYGTEARHVRALADDDPALAGPLVPGLPYTRAEAVFAVRHEMATTLDDVLCRRTRAHLEHRDAAAAAAPAVVELLARELGWPETERHDQLAAYLAICDGERAAAVVA